MDELRQADLEREFAEWQFSVGVDRLPHARRPKTSPPVWLTGEDWTDLRDQVRAWIARRHQGAW
jgi:hypothetical protein